MATQCSVQVHGPVLSALLQECVSSTGDKEGFIVGARKRSVVRHIADDTDTGSSTRLVFEAHAFCPVPRAYFFYDRACRVDPAKVAAVGGRDKNVIGWYRLRRNTPLRPSFREQLVHERLQKLYGGKDFLFGILSASCAEVHNLSTHCFDYKFFIRGEGPAPFQSLQVRIPSLEKHEVDAYRHFEPFSGASNGGADADAEADSGMREVIAKDRLRTASSAAVEASFVGGLERMAQLAARTEALDREVAAVRKQVKKHKEFLAAQQRRRTSSAKSSS